jgi:dTDP-4-amino-4,6-dideoxygalactose transaminase
LKLDRIHKTHRQVFEEFRENNIGVNLHYIPIYAQPYYQRLGFDSINFPEAEKYYAEAVSLPVFAGLTNAQQDQVIYTLKSILMK